MPEIVVKSVAHTYIENSNEHMILDDIDLSIPKGKSICIMGASGSGKSTLLHILSGLLKPNMGEILYDGMSLAKLSSSKLTQFRSQYMGFMFQNQHFFPELSVLDNISLPLRILAKPNVSEKAVKQLALMQLNESLYERYPYELSGGEQARVGLGRALIHSPNLLFADEPTSALDDELTQMIFRDIKALQKELGFSMIVATHDPSLLKYFDQVYNLKGGKIETA